ncbi:hypothetical protein RYD26_12145 [Pasteurellaceae bacterium LIM206]|nr:hypothetical protein [Pasteurellaceae bacterium LIM206]
MKKLLILCLLLLVGGCMRNDSYPLDNFSPEQKVLVKAIQKGDLDQVKVLIPKTNLNLWKKDSIPLLTAAFIDAIPDKANDNITPRLQIVTELMRGGAPFTVTAGFPESPLGIALAQEHPAFLKAMLEGGLDPNYQQEGATIIFDTLSNRKLELVKLLVKSGANIEFKSSATGGETPAYSAMWGIAPRVSWYLVSIGANTNVMNAFGTRSFAMATYIAEKDLLESIARIKAGGEGDLNALQEDLDAVQKVKAVMIERGQEWPPKK